MIAATPTVEWVSCPGGRRVAFSQHGDPQGAPVVFCHGWLGSRLTRHPHDGLTASLGVRLITVDRAGIGRSDPVPAKTLLSSAGDLARVADALGLERFALFGHSGGGPYALACAHALPERVSAVAVASGFAPFDRPAAYTGMTARMRGFTRLLRAAPWLAGPFMRSAPKRFRSDPEKAFAQQFGELCPSDAAALEDPATHALLLAAATEALAAGHAGVAAESRLLFARPWGFSPADMRCRVELWYGDADTIVPLQMGRHLAHTIPAGRLHILPGEGHMAYLTHWADILRALIR